jgi:IS5 family transposase
MKTIHQSDIDVTQSESIEAVWAWVSEQHYTRLCEANPNELLVRVWQGFDWRGIEKGCSGYRRYAGGRGQEATHTNGQLVRGLVVKSLKGWSLRETCRAIGTNGLVRGFVGYRLDEKTLSYATLQRFERWMGEHAPRLIFDEILRQIDGAFPDEGKQVQVGDTFALLANVARQGRTELIRGVARHLYKTWSALSPEPSGTGLTAEEREALWGKANEAPEYWLDKDGRDERERQTALAAYGFLRLAQAAQPLLPLRERVLQAIFERQAKILEKVLSDEFVFVQGETGEVSSARHATEKERGSFVLGSSVDVEATFRKHGDRSDLGYNIHVSATHDFVREIFATTGAVPDAAGVGALIAHQAEQGFSLPPKLIYDRAAGSPKTFHAVDVASQGQTQLVATLIDHSKNKGRFGPLDFTLNEDGSLTCPAGRTTSTAYRCHTADGWTYRFSAGQCQGCPLWDACRGPRTEATEEATLPTSTPQAKHTPQAKRKGTKATGHRQVFISSYRSAQRGAILYTQSEAFKADMKQRCAIERVIAALVRYNGARRARSTGLAKADFQVRMAAVAFNLKHWLVMRLAQEKAQRYHPPPEEEDG